MLTALVVNLIAACAVQGQLSTRPAANVADLALSLETSAPRYLLGEPLKVRLIVRNMSDEEVRAPFRDNAEFYNRAEFRIHFRRDGEVAGERLFVRTEGGHPIIFSFAAGAELRMETYVVAGATRRCRVEIPNPQPKPTGRITGPWSATVTRDREVFELLPPGTYQLVATLKWGSRGEVLESPPVSVHIQSTPDAAKDQVDYGIALLLEQSWDRSTQSDAAKALIRDKPDSKLVEALREQGLWERYNVLKGTRPTSAAEGAARRVGFRDLDALGALSREIEAFLDGRKLFCGRLYYALADLQLAYAHEVTGRGYNAGQPLDAPTRESLRAAWRTAVAAVKRLQRDIPGAAHLPLARALLAERIASIERSYDAPAEWQPPDDELRAGIAILKEALP